MYRVAIISLGDLGRSPRMQYHAHSFAKLDDTQEVTLIGYSGEKCMELVQNQNKIKIIQFSIDDKIPNFICRIPFIRTIAKGIMIVFQILLILYSLNLSTLNAIIIQNPPCTPAAIAAILLSVFYPIKIVIDWHNLGFKMFEEKLGERHIFVNLSKILEFLIAHASSGHICVSHTMKEWLQDNIYIHPQVVYDRPAHIFNRNGTDLRTKHDLFSKLDLTDSSLFPRVTIPIRSNTQKISSSTVSTELLSIGSDKRGVVMAREDSAHVFVTSTSWTPDEDFPSLLEAMIQLDQQLRVLNSSAQKTASSSSSSALKTGHNSTGRIGDGYQRALLLITGKGPLKESFMAKVKQLETDGSLIFVAIRSLWLEPHEYPLLLGSCDIGICMHTSTSGLDLPMKVLDMFGSGLPVCAAFYQAVHELVGHEYNGLLFSSASELVAHLLRLCLLAPQNLYPFVTDESELVGDEEDYVHISSSKPTALGIKRISEEKLSARADADSKTVNSGRKGSQAEAKDTPTIDNTRSNVESKRKIGISEQKDISTTGYTSVSTTPLSALKTQPLTDIQRLKQGVLAIDTWDENWEQSMKPYILDILQKKSIPLVWSPSFAIIFFIFNLFGVYSLSLLLK